MADKQKPASQKTEKPSAKADKAQATKAAEAPVKATKAKAEPAAKAAKADAPAKAAKAPKTAAAKTESAKAEKPAKAPKAAATEAVATEKPAAKTKAAKGAKAAPEVVEAPVQAVAEEKPAKAAKAPKAAKAEAVKPEPVVEATPAEKPRRGRKPKSATETTVEAAAPAAEAVAAEAAVEAPVAEAQASTEKTIEGAGRGRRRRRDDAKPEVAPSEGAQAAGEEAPAESAAPAREARPPREPQPEPKKFVASEVAERGVALVNELGTKLGMVLTVSSAVEKNVVRLDIDGDDAQSRLLGNGRTPQRLDALQTWLQAAIFETDAPQNIELTLDVNGFRQRRTEELDKLAGVLANSVSKLKKSVVIAGLNSFERRVVHRALESEKAIQTESEGVGSFRKLRLEPRA